MKRFRLRSLRTQMALLGMIAVLLPIAALVLVVLATTDSSEIVTEPALAGDLQPGGEPREGFSSSTESETPTEVLLAAAGLAILATGVVWWWSGRAIAPMRRITDVANQIQAGSLDRRIALSGAAEEVQALGDSFDDMLDRLADSVTSQHRLIEDASHELRTPLAALAVNNEIMREAKAPTLDDYAQSAARSEALIERLQLTIDELLVDARSRNEAVRQVDNELMAIIGRVASQHRALHPDHELIVEGPSMLRLGIDGPSIERALVNLVDNAVRYSPSDMPVTITVDPRHPASVSVIDMGEGIEPDDIDQIFDRYHGDGTGIGLAVVKQVAEAHGRIDVVSPLPGSSVGTRFTITFTGRSG